MEVKYRNTFWELIWFNFYQLPRVLSFQIAAALIIVYMGYSLFRSWTARDYSLLEQIVSFIIVLFQFLLLVIAILFILFVFLRFTSQHFRSQINQDCRLVVSQSGVVNESPTKRTELNWSGISKVSQTRNAILIYLSEQSAFVISKRSFPNQGEAKSFFEHTFNLWKASRNMVLSK